MFCMNNHELVASQKSLATTWQHAEYLSNTGNHPQHNRIIKVNWQLPRTPQQPHINMLNTLATPSIAHQNHDSEFIITQNPPATALQYANTNHVFFYHMMLYVAVLQILFMLIMPCLICWDHKSKPYYFYLYVTYIYFFAENVSHIKHAEYTREVQMI